MGARAWPRQGHCRGRRPSGSFGAGQRTVAQVCAELSHLWQPLQLRVSQVRAAAAGRRAWPRPPRSSRPKASVLRVAGLRNRPGRPVTWPQQGVRNADLCSAHRRNAGTRANPVCGARRCNANVNLRHGSTWPRCLYRTHGARAGIFSALRAGEVRISEMDDRKRANKSPPTRTARMRAEFGLELPAMVRCTGSSQRNSRLGRRGARFNCGSADGGVARALAQGSLAERFSWREAWLDPAGGKGKAVRSRWPSRTLCEDARRGEHVVVIGR